MKDLRWSLLFAAVVMVWACKPFVGPKMDGGSDVSLDVRSASGETSSATDATEINRTDATADQSASVDAELERSDSRSELDGVASGTSDVGTTDVKVTEAGCDATGPCKKPDGEICLADSECSTGTCGGRCCAAGCTCTQPSPANLLKDPSFDRGISGWTVNAGALVRSPSDAERCAYSGSLSITIPAGGAERSVERCIGNIPLRGDFNFGAKVLIDGGNMASVPACQIIFFSGFNCDADQIATNETDSTRPTTGWQDLTASLAMVSGANSATFRCALLGDPAVETTFYFDMVYVSRAPSLY